MFESSFLSNMTMMNWNSAIQWYFNHLNTAPLIHAWQDGQAFSQHDWQTFLVLNVNFLVLFSLVRLLVAVHQKSAFHGWVQNKRSQLKHRPQKESQTRIEAKITDSECLNQAYNLHRFAMYDGALNKYKQAFQSSPYELNTYLVGIKIISEMEEPDQQFVQFLQSGIAKLRTKRPAIWNEVARYGQEKAPGLYQWQLAP